MITDKCPPLLAIRSVGGGKKVLGGGFRKHRGSDQCLAPVTLNPPRHFLGRDLARLLQDTHSGGHLILCQLKKWDQVAKSAIV